MSRVPSSVPYQFPSAVDPNGGGGVACIPLPHTARVLCTRLNAGSCTASGGADFCLPRPAQGRGWRSGFRGRCSHCTADLCASAAEERRTLRCSGFAWPSLRSLARTAQTSVGQGPIKWAPCLRWLRPVGSGCTLQGRHCIAWPLPSDAFAWRAFERTGRRWAGPHTCGLSARTGLRPAESAVPSLRRAALACTAWRAFGRAG